MLALFLTERNVTLLQRREVRLRVLHPLQRRVPAMFSFSCYQAVFGIGQIILPTRPLGFIARFFQRQCQCLSLHVLLGDDLLKGLQGGMDTRGLERLQHGCFDGAIHTESTNRQARGGATIHPAPSTDIPGPGRWCHYRRP